MIGQNLIPEGDIHSDELRKLLTESVGIKLDHSLEELKQILYRLDVPEQKVTEVFLNQASSNWPVAIADLIIEREKIRLAFRKKYSES